MRSSAVRNLVSSTEFEIVNVISRALRDGPASYAGGGAAGDMKKPAYWRV